MPHLNTPEKQLKVVTNLIHALGRVVGMDIIPHTDRYSEQALANPSCYEWLMRDDMTILNHEENLHKVVEQHLFEFLQKRNQDGLPDSAPVFFAKDFHEDHRLYLMFGEKWDYAGRLAKRKELIQYLYNLHFETVPATMGPPYRGLAVDTNPDAMTVDAERRVWRDYKITRPEKFSRVFGPLARFKLYRNLDNNANWAIDFEQPIIANWEYIASHYAKIQADYNFDFMRGDMAHVQMRNDAQLLKSEDAYYDIMGYIKNYIGRYVPHFGSFAETFLAPPGEMAYGDEVVHLIRAGADTTLGDLQSMVVGEERFMKEFGRYLDILHTSSLVPNFTLMTADKDDPRFDSFYLSHNEARYFIALFLTEMPSYMGLGFECRDPHPIPTANEYYTKLYVFHLDGGKNATKGSYKWGQNKTLFSNLEKIKALAESILPTIMDKKVVWLSKPSATNKQITWTHENSLHTFKVNLKNGELQINDSIIIAP
jgi:hypothetical protein